MQSHLWLLLVVLAFWPSLLTCQDKPHRVKMCPDEDLSCPEKPHRVKMCADGERTRICVPDDYIKFELPEEDRPTNVSIGVDIKDIPKVNDKDFSITLNAYFIVKWQDRRLIVERRNRTSSYQIEGKGYLLFCIMKISITHFKTKSFCLSTKYLNREGQ